MKFKDDGHGFRDLRVQRDDEHVLTLSIDDTDPKKSGFVGIKMGKRYASFHLTRREMRDFAKAILKETSK